MQTKLTHDELLRCGAAKRAICGLPWHHMPGGRDRWSDIAQDLNAMIANGTSDGRPWVEPERPIERGEWVMVRNFDDPRHQWHGPEVYRCDIDDGEDCRHAVIGGMELFRYVRRATAEEVADTWLAE